MPRRGSAIKNAIQLITAKARQGAIPKATQDSILRRTKLAQWSTAAVKNAVQQSPILAGFVLLDMYGDDSAEVREFMDAYPEFANLVNNSRPEDEASASVFNSLQMQDEFQAIQTAVAFFGSIERFTAIRRALSFSPETIASYVAFRDMAAAVRPR